MKEIEAMQWYHGRDRLNCAQAVLKAFQQEAGLPDEVIRAASRSGGGMAPGGACGAFHAARVLLGGQELLEPVAQAFEIRAGSTRCREIRAGRKLSCRECVALSAHELELLLDAIQERAQAACEVL
jgi:hypothetical protein